MARLIGIIVLALVGGIARAEEPSEHHQVAAAAQHPCKAEGTFALLPGVVSGHEVAFVFGGEAGVAGACEVGEKTEVVFGTGFGLNMHLAFGPSLTFAVFGKVARGFGVGVSATGFADFTAHGYEATGLYAGPAVKFEFPVHAVHLALTLAPSVLYARTAEGVNEVGGVFKAEFALSKKKKGH